MIPWVETLAVCAWLRDVGRELERAVPVGPVFMSGRLLEYWSADRALSTVCHRCLDFL